MSERMEEMFKEADRFCIFISCFNIEMNKEDILDKISDKLDKIKKGDA